MPEGEQPEVKNEVPTQSEAQLPQISTEQIVPAGNDVVVTQPLAETNVQPKKKAKHLPFLAIALALVVVGTVFWVFRTQVIGIFVKQPDVVQSTGQGSSTAPIDISKTNDPELIKFVTPTTGETWLAAPKDIAPQGWLKAEQLSFYQNGYVAGQGPTPEQQLKDNMPTYKEVGSRAGNTIVFVFSPGEGYNGVDYLFEKHADGKVAIIVKPQARAADDPNALTTAKDATTNLVTVYDQETHYDSLNVPKEIAIGKGEKVTLDSYFSIGASIGATDNTVRTTLVLTLGSSSLYRIERKYADTNLTNIGYYVKTPFGTKIGMQYNPNQPSLEGYTFTNNASLQYRDYNGKTVYDELYAIARGCGGTEAAVTRSDILKEADLVQVGVTNTGRAIYEIKDKSASLYVKAYGEYKESRAQGETVESFDDYVKNHGLVIIKNASDELLVYTRGQYRMYGGCAKPVVYLYPQTATVVNVQVGANVTVSDPEYTARGWRGVLAQPNGQLTYQGKVYDSLFWEGQGFGTYPGITSGTVVKRADAAATIRRQLAEQGLNTKETNDFMAFWESKIPNKPYIRLTWLTTEQMDVLAPLRISPKPDTMFRVFLDMDGFDTPIQLPAQRLPKVDRKGFTVIEWGGLTSLMK